MIRRRLFIFASAASAVLFTVSGAMWARSLGHFERIDVRYNRSARADELHCYYLGFAWYSNTFRVHIARRRFEPSHFQGQSQQWLSSLRASYPLGLKLAFLGEDVTQVMNGYPPGFAAYHRRDAPGKAVGDQWILAVRPWLPTLVTAVTPAIWLWRRLRARSWQFGLRHLLFGVLLLAVALAVVTGMMR